MAIGYGRNITDAEIKSGQIDLGNGEFIKVSGEGGKDTTITKEQADKLFSKDLGRYETIVVRAIGQEAYNKLSQNQKTAILSYVYNTGRVPDGFADAIKAGNYANAAKSIRDGVATASGEKDPVRRKQLEAGLKIRRKKEADLFDTAGPATSEQRSSSGMMKTSFTPSASGGGNEMESQNATYRPAQMGNGQAVSRSISASTVIPVSNVVPNVDAEIRKAAGSYTQRETDANTQRVLRELGGQSKESRPSSGSTTRSLTGPVQVEDKKANAILSKQLKTSTVVARETGVVARSTTSRETRKQTTLLQRANQTFLNQFQSTTQRLLSKAIYDTLVVGAYGKEGSRGLVTKQQTQGETYRGQQVAKLINLNRGTEKVLTGVFGKKIGKAYAPMVAQLGTAYLEAGATKVGRSLFSSILGNDKDSDALTGQILGNFAKGNKQAATEQLLYGLTGVASGPETIFAKYGFGSSQAGANFLGGYGAAQITAPIAGMLGGNQPTYRGPNGQGTYGAGQSPIMQPAIQQPATQQGAYYTGFNAKGNQQTFVNPEHMKLAIEGDKAAQKELPHIADGTWKQLEQAKDDLKVKTEQYLEAKAGTAEFETARAARDQAQARLTERTNELLEKQPTSVGGGSSAGGNFMSNMGNFAFDLGTSLVASKLTQNIKNPYIKAIANYGISSAASSFIKPMIFGAPGVAGAAGAAAAPSLFSMGNVATLGKSLMPGSAVGFAGTAGNILANSGYTTAGNFMTGVQSGLNLASGTAEGVGYAASGMTGSLALGESVGKFMGSVAPYAPYAAAAIQLLKGDVKGAATTAAFTYAGKAIGNYFFPGVGGIVGGFIGSIVGGLFGKKKQSRPPPVSIYRVLGVVANEVNGIQTTYTSGAAAPAEWSKFADTILMALFNSAKLMQQMSGKPLPFEHIGIYLHQDNGIQMSLHQPGEPLDNSNTKWNKNFGPLSSWKAGTGIVSMIEFMRDCLKEGKDAITAEKLDKASADLKSKSIQTITSGVLRELKTGGQYDLAKGVGYDRGTPTAAGRKAVARNTTSTANTATARTTTGTTTSGGAANTAAALLTSAASISAAADAITPGAKNTSATSLTSSAETTNMTNSAPINSVVTVGGKTENDNSMNVTNINQMSPMNDPWRQPSYNTNFQLVAA